MEGKNLKINLVAQAGQFRTGEHDLVRVSKGKGKNLGERGKYGGRCGPGKERIIARAVGEYFSWVSSSRRFATREPWRWG